MDLVAGDSNMTQDDVQPSPVLEAVSRAPVKKALCIACRYDKLSKDMHLHGTYNDPNRMKDLLIKHYGFHKENIHLMVEHKIHHPQSYPSREHIMNALRDLVKDAQAGDHFVFVFSGHGSQVECLTGEEEDGYDEVIWPADINYSEDDGSIDNFIRDNDLKHYLVDSLPQGAHLTAVFDCCHSGTAMDLPTTDADNSVDTLWSPMSPVYNPIIQDPPEEKYQKSTSILTRKLDATAVGQKRDDDDSMHVVTHTDVDNAKPSNAHVTSWSACLDDQIGLECTNGGILVSSLTSVLENKPNLTHRELLHELAMHLLSQAKEAKNWSRQHNNVLVIRTPPKPQLGCLVPLQAILDTPFTF